MEKSQEKECTACKLPNMTTKELCALLTKKDQVIYVCKACVAEMMAMDKYQGKI